ncbi:hypothetical protein AB6A40_008665 [Gnathostoma spinigerum]|uniref:Uncharacterized protein n=1 Tax=Gnathostoma spinigerum TaxID=75299 RepID=A0ABD6EWT6_9BILA
MKSLSENSAGSSSELQTSSWPSRTSILETPERTRCRLSISFADSGLGSSMFGSPPNSQETVSTSPPVLRTPTGSVGGSISRPKRSTSPSPIRNFVHMSPYSSSFSSPIHGSSPSRLQLSNPEHATGFRFSGANLRKGELFDNLTNFEARKNECSATTSSPHHTKRTTGSRVINRCLNMPSVSSNRYLNASEFLSS